VQEGQQVEIGVDAFPDRKYTGEIIYVSSIGEQKQNSSSKVFEVKVRIFETATTLRPAMTTSNRIILSTQEDVLYIPSDCIHRRDSLHFVYTNQGEELIKQEVRTGAYNENETVIESGLKEGQKIYLSVPEGAEEAPLQRLDATSLIFERDIKPTSMLNQFPVGITPVQPFMASPA
jgi:multidrug efflux pump subunit AcrA (membrane-fusion protein)